MLTKELDIVRLKDGRTATVLEVFESGKAYLVEVVDANGKTLDTITVGPDDIEKVVWKA